MSASSLWLEAPGPTANQPPKPPDNNSESAAAEEHKKNQEGGGGERLAKTRTASQFSATPRSRLVEPTTFSRGLTPILFLWSLLPLLREARSYEPAEAARRMPRHRMCHDHNRREPRQVLRSPATEVHPSTGGRHRIPPSFFGVCVSLLAQVATDNDLRPDLKGKGKG